MLVPESTQVVFDDACRADFDAVGLALRRVNWKRLNVAGVLRSAERNAIVDSSVVIVGPRTSDGQLSDLTIARLRHAGPHLAIYVGLEMSRDQLPRIRALVDAGIDEIVGLHAPTDLLVLTRLIGNRLAAPAPEPEIRALTAMDLESGALAIAEHCFRNGHRPRSASSIARWFGVDRTTLNRHLSAAGLPGGLMLARCGRACHIVELERRGIRSRSEIVRRLTLTASPQCECSG